MNAQAQSVASVTSTQSLVLMKNMMRISVSSICYHRHLFPSICFRRREYGNAKDSGGKDTTSIHTLEPASEDKDGNVQVENQDAFLLTQWLERGVFQALEDKYLETMQFAIMTSNPVTGEEMLLETYDFCMSYQQGCARINGEEITKQSLKTQANKFVRALIEFSTTLEDLPQHRWLTLQLSYIDSCPSDYQPMYFDDSSDDPMPVLDDNKAMNIRIGKLLTPHHDLEVSFAGIEDYGNLFDAELQTNIKSAKKNVGVIVDSGHGDSTSSNKKKVTKNFGSKQFIAADADTEASKSNASFKSKGQGANMRSKKNIIPETESMQIDNVDSNLKQMSFTSPFGSQSEVETDKASSDSETYTDTDTDDDDDVDYYQIVKDYIIQEGKSIMSNCVAALNLPQNEVKSIFLRLAKEGYITQGKGNRFAPTKKFLRSNTIAATITVPSAPQKLKPAGKDSKLINSMNSESATEDDSQMKISKPTRVRRNLTSLTQEETPPTEDVKKASKKRPAGDIYDFPSSQHDADDDDETQEAEMEFSEEIVLAAPKPRSRPAALKRRKISRIKEPIHLYSTDQNSNSQGDSEKLSQCDRADYSYSMSQ